MLYSLEESILEETIVFHSSGERAIVSLCAGAGILCDINTDVQTNSLNCSHSKWGKKKKRDTEEVLLKFMELQQELILITSPYSALID